VKRTLTKDRRRPIAAFESGRRLIISPIIPPGACRRLLSPNFFDFSSTAFVYQRVIMSSGLPSDEVAEDYKNSLEDLTTNDRFQISNLTVIAKENTEHAMAISRVLENHIRTVGAFSSTPPVSQPWWLIDCLILESPWSVCSSPDGFDSTFSSCLAYVVSP
jgi:hypothetical protein